MSGKEQEEGHACMLGLGKQVMFLSKPLGLVGVMHQHLGPILGVCSSKASVAEMYMTLIISLGDFVLARNHLCDGTRNGRLTHRSSSFKCCKTVAVRLV